MDALDAFKTIGMSLGLGLLVGMQREHAESQVAGIRTFALVTLLGTLLAMLSDSPGGWPVAAGALALAVLLYVANLAKMRRGENEPGMTTEVAALVMFAVGAYLAHGHAGAAVLVGGIVAVLLQLKQPMHAFVRGMDPTDIRVIMQFVVLALVILPVLPDENYGPFGAFNPRETWLMVVLIVGLNLAGYAAYKFFAPSAGALLGGVLGGLVSSTATTVSYSRRAQQGPATESQALLVITIASAVAFARVLFLVGVAAAPMFRYLAPPLVVAFLWMLVLTLVVYWFTGRSDEKPEPPKNPAELKTAIAFGAMYAGIKLVVAAAHHYLGDQGLYTVAGLSGLTDVDAITLSTARLVDQQQLSAHVGWQMILLAKLVNLVFKGGVAAVLGTRRLAWRTALVFGAALAVGFAVLLLWPSDLVDGWIDAATSV